MARKPKSNPKRAKKTTLAAADLAFAAGYPFSAVTNRNTLLIRLGAPSQSLDQGTSLTVFSEDEHVGVCRAEITGSPFGSVAKSDYDPL